MPAPIVEQLVNGVKVRLGDGREVTCKPLPLLAAMQILDAWDVMGRETEPAEVRAAARLRVLRLFAEQYPELATEVAAGDVEELVQGFFWGRTGAAVVRPAEDPTGTASGASTSPTGASSPT